MADQNLSFQGEGGMRFVRMLAWEQGCLVTTVAIPPTAGCCPVLATTTMNPRVVFAVGGCAAHAPFVSTFCVPVGLNGVVLCLMLVPSGITRECRSWCAANAGIPPVPG